ncbi:MAG: ATP-binding protein [Victivallales bacterium]
MQQSRIKLFVSSVQKELEIERVSVAGCVSSDEQLSNKCEVVLFDKQPLSGKRIVKPYLDCLASCQIYLLIIDCEYGHPPDPLSATHEEYRFACGRDMPILVFIRGKDDKKREEKTKAFIDEIKKDHNTYRRFHDRLDLLPEVKEALRRVLRETFKMDLEEPEVTKTPSDSASQFEQQILDISADEIDLSMAAQWLVSIKEIPAGQPLPDLKCLNILRQKGLVRLEGKIFRTQASGILFLGKNPAIHFSQCRIFCDAFKGTVADSDPADQITLSGPAPSIVQNVLDFVMKNTRHPMRVVGLNRVSLDEYPQEAVREAIVNAIAHRNYEDSARHIIIKLFSDRLEILSPGILMRPLTLQKINKGNYLPCSRNPVLGQYLNHLRLMEQRGSGMGRMKKAMLDHGLDVPLYDEFEGYFKVMLKGPGDNLDRLRLPENRNSSISPSIENQLNERQKKILEKAVKDGKVTARWAMSELSIAKDTAVRDFNSLCGLALLIKKGRGRNVSYVPSTEK